jgi:helix-turn-helix protein
MDWQLAPLAVPIVETQRLLGGISRTSVYELVKSGQLKKIKIGRRGLITVASLNALVDRLSEAQARDAEDGAA